MRAIRYIRARLNERSTWLLIGTGIAGAAPLASPWSYVAAVVEKVLIRWDRDWDMDRRYMERGETDGPHFEMVRR